MPNSFLTRQRDISAGSGIEIDYATTDASVNIRAASSSPGLARLPSTAWNWVSDTAFTLGTKNNVIGIYSSTGVQWGIPDVSVNYTDTLVTIDLAAVFNKLGITSHPTDWALLLGGGLQGEQGATFLPTPAKTLPVYDTTWNICYYLDATFSTLSFQGWISGVTAIILTVVSKDPLVTGEITINLIVSGVTVGTVQVPVTATPANVTVPLNIALGMLELQRDYNAVTDTLKDIDPVTCIVLDCKIKSA